MGRGKQGITYVMNICKWLAKQEIRDIAKRHTLRATKDKKNEEFVESHDCPLSKATQHKKNEVYNLLGETLIDNVMVTEFPESKNFIRQHLY